MKLLPLFLSLLLLVACQAKREVPVVENPEGNGVHIPRPEVVAKPSASAMPKALVYKTSGNYNDNVFILMDAQGNILSYPAPSDVTAASAPLPLEGGWLLDRRGIADNAAFLSWTWTEYHALPASPSLSELKAHIIPGAKVAQILRLPYTVAEAEADTSAVNNWLKSHVPTAVLK